MEAGTALLVGYAIDAVAAGLTRAAVVDKVKLMAAQGASPEQIAEALRNMRVASEVDAQAAVDKA